MRLLGHARKSGLVLVLTRNSLSNTSDICDTQFSACTSEKGDMEPIEQQPKTQNRLTQFGLIQHRVSQTIVAYRQRI